MDKQKQAEKIANTIYDYLEGTIVGNEQTLAKIIYEKILPEDNVVLTKEEWENYKSSFRNQLYCKDIQYGIEIKELRNDRDYWREEYRQARKETAEKIYTFINSFGTHNWERFKEFIKQFGVEIKE